MTDLSNADILRAAKRLIEEQSHFVMGAPAWNRKGREVDPLSPDAWRWNSRGAIWAASGVRPLAFKELAQDRLVYRLIDESAHRIAETQGIRLPVGKDMADNLGHALTLKAFDDAIASAEAS